VHKLTLVEKKCAEFVEYFKSENIFRNFKTALADIIILLK